MNRDEVGGKVDQAKGEIKQGAGAVTGDEKLRAEGKFDEVKGKTKEAYGEAKDKAADFADRVREGDRSDT